jgi:16S rRNA (guanine527-N7)-methyltransferase
MNIVSHETQKQIYGALLKKWQAKINLVSKNTLDVWAQRHWDDSVQLNPILAQMDFDVILDLGSGGGFPALPLKITNPDLDIHCIESDERKCSFLKTVSRETKASIHVHNQRIEDFVRDFTCVDEVRILITARAFSSVLSILDYVQPLNLKYSVQFLLLKGANFQIEIDEAMQSYALEYTLFDSQTHADAKIIRISSCVLLPKNATLA